MNGFFLPAGCDKKLTEFFIKGKYKSMDASLFTDNTKIKVLYNQKFDSFIQYDDNEFIKEADALLKEKLQKIGKTTLS